MIHCHFTDRVMISFVICQINSILFFIHENIVTLKVYDEELNVSILMFCGKIDDAQAEMSLKISSSSAICQIKDFFCL